jgi:putative membrane protein
MDLRSLVQNDMHIRKGQLLILIFNLCQILFFSIYFLTRANYEFVLYVGVIIFFLAVFIAANDKVFFPNFVLWGLSIWALLHMLGGSVHIKDTVLYNIIIIRLSDNYPVFKFDQFVHIFGFGVATLAMFYVLKPLLKTNAGKWWSLSIIVISAGLGIGALNEIIEFAATVLVPETNVGGYTNTALDLVSNFVGAVFAMLVIHLKEKKIFNNN